jgi:hypothetical protein
MILLNSKLQCISWNCLVLKLSMFAGGSRFINTCLASKCADFLIQIMYIWMNSIVMFRPATWIWFISFYLFKRGLPTANFKISPHHDIAELLLMLVLNTNQPTANCYEEICRNAQKLEVKQNFSLICFVLIICKQIL